MSDLPEFRYITPDRVDALYQELFKAYDNENAATKWTVRRLALEALEREQERITRIHVATYSCARDQEEGAEHE